MTPHSSTKLRAFARQAKRYSHYRDLTVVYEGHPDHIPLHAPDLSPQGMFINTPYELPEGAVLQVRFRLAHSDYVVNARCEVRYCLPSVGVGVEFVQISSEAERAIRRAISHAPLVPAG